MQRRESTQGEDITKETAFELSPKRRSVPHCLSREWCGQVSGQSDMSADARTAYAERLRDQVESGKQTCIGGPQKESIIESNTVVTQKLKVKSELLCDPEIPFLNYIQKI